MANVIKVGDLTNSFLKREERPDSVVPLTPESYDHATTAIALIADIATRLENLEGQIEIKVDKDGIPSAITLAQDAMLITSDKIGVLGDVTFADYLRDQSGTATGVIDPSVTRIRGGVIQTEQIISGNWSTIEGSVIDLDNGNIFIGGSKDPKLEYDNTEGTLSIRGDIIVEDTFEADLVTVAEYGKFVTGTAGYTLAGGFTGSGILVGSPGIYGLNSGNVKLGFDATTGNVEIQGSLLVGSTISDDIYIGSKTGLTMQTETGTAQTTANTGVANAATADAKAVAAQDDVDSPTFIADRLSQSTASIHAANKVTLYAGTTSGGEIYNGIALGDAGFFGRKSGVDTFSIDLSGNAIFKGDITGATGTFAGTISSAEAVSVTTTTTAYAYAGYFVNNQTARSGIYAFGATYGIKATGTTAGVWSIGGISSEGDIVTSNGAYDLGTSSSYWGNLYATSIRGTNSYLSYQKVTLNFDSSCLPTTDSVSYLGSDTKRWLYMYADKAVITERIYKNNGNDGTIKVRLAGTSDSYLEYDYTFQ